MKEKIIENGIEYVRRGDYYYPNVEVPKKHRQLGAYGRLHKEFIKNHRKGFYSSLILQGKLDEYLYELNREAYRMLNELIDYFAENEGVTEEKYLCFTFCLALKRFTFTCSSVRFKIFAISL